MDQRLRYTRYITYFTICIILCNQLILLRQIYEEENTQYIKQHNNQITRAIYEFNMKSSDLENTMLNFDAKNSMLTYIIHGKTIKCQLNAKDDIKRITERSTYDIRNPELWTLKNFYSYLKEKQDSLQQQNFSIQFAIQDSTGKIKDTYPEDEKNLLVSPVYCDTLGYISGDILYATYNYPIGLFIQTVFYHIILAILITVLFVFCILNLYFSYRDEKRSGEYREQYIHSIVHDLKRPVENQIKLCYLLTHLEKSEQAGLLAQSGAQLREMSQSIDRMLLQSTDSHGLRLNPREFDLKKMLETLAQPDRWRVDDEKEFNIKTYFLSTNKLIKGDADFLYAVLQNLVDNSLKYSGDHVRVEITCGDLDTGHVRIGIKDNGLGISPEALKHIFKRYHRGDHQGDKEIKGHGQGMYYARLIVNAHKGKIEIESTPGEGTTIRIDLPRQLKKY